MSDPVQPAAASALAELLEVSPQVDAAVILERDGGTLVAGAPASGARAADQLGATCVRIVDAAEQARRELGREPVSQVEVATPDGHVFVVADATWIVAAVTDADPTVGLVFYDLKTALRAVRESRVAAAIVSAEPSSNGDTPVVEVLTTATGDDVEAATDGTGSTTAADSTSSGDTPADDGERPQRWRRRKS
jgi:predicted regulator of Ras-like GTPase activity (Roadblock/LC7/MglB family)